MQNEKQQAFLIHVAYYLMIIFFLYLFFRYIIYAIMPFLIGFFIAFMLRPLIQKLSADHHGRFSFYSTIVILLFYLLLSLLFIWMFWKGFFFAKQFFLQFPSFYDEQIAPFIHGSFFQVKTVWANVDAASLQNMELIMEHLQQSLYSMVIQISSNALTYIANFAASIPKILISFGFAIMSSFFFNADLNHILAFFLRQFTPEGQKILFSIRHFFSETMIHLAIAYLKLMTLTFLELCIGFFFLNIRQGFRIAFLISLFDIFPVLGCGGIMIPWITLMFLQQQTKKAVGLLILYLIITMIRNILEPKVLSSHIGLHPLFMLASMYLGVKLFRTLGILIMPLLLLAIQDLNDKELIHFYRK